PADSAHSRRLAAPRRLDNLSILQWQHAEHLPPAERGLRLLARVRRRLQIAAWRISRIHAGHSRPRLGDARAGQRHRAQFLAGQTRRRRLRALAAALEAVELWEHRPTAGLPREVAQRQSLSVARRPATAQADAGLERA